MSADIKAPSETIYQDIQCAFQRVAVVGKRSDPLVQLGARNGSKFLNPYDPCRAIENHMWRQNREARVTPLFAQGCNDVGRLDADQIGLQIDDKLA